ncbi:hypothetical protein Golomagni_08115 [Golovinomyces magnicellulatus]|nr:hypothetical protein Golomagni_08115 [Golovinomyces magnicellulatus]
MAEVFRKVEGGIGAVFDNQPHSHTHPGRSCDHLHPPENVANRFQSFAPQSKGRIKWFVDGCSYFWAVSEAIQNAKRSIHILDWWLSPEVYLRRPPATNEQYRLDVMLKSAAERGVKVNIIVYREVSAALSLNSSVRLSTVPFGTRKHGWKAYITTSMCFDIPNMFPRATMRGLSLASQART